MTQILLKNNYFIIVKKGGYFLQKRTIKRNPQTGEVKETVKKCGYHNSMEDCIRTYIKHMTDEILEDEVMELKEYAKAVDQCAQAAVKDLVLPKE